MKRNNFALRLEPSLLSELRQVAKDEGVAVNQLINTAVAEKLSAVRTQKFFEARLRRADMPRALAILQKAGRGNAPEPGDELPAARTTKRRAGPGRRAA